MSYREQDGHLLRTRVDDLAMVQGEVDRLRSANRHLEQKLRIGRARSYAAYLTLGGLGIGLAVNLATGKEGFLLFSVLVGALFGALVGAMK